VYGNFSAPKAQEIVAARGDVLELLRPDATGRLAVAASVAVHGTLRALAPFRLTGAPRDCLVVGSDSGRIVVLEVVPDPAADEGSGALLFKRVHCETFGKSGVRRAVPGQHLAVDPKGRAVLIGALERAKLVYVLNRTADAALTISSPLEAHKSRSLCHAVAGLDVGYDNPVFAAIEEDCGAVDDGEAEGPPGRTLTLYELDLGLNHVVRASADPVPPTATLLVPVPGGGDGPGGVLVCCEDVVEYRPPGGGGKGALAAALPRRASLPAHRGTMIVASATHKQKALFFALLQSEYGDVFKATLECPAGGGAPTSLTLSYFDTVPPAAALCVLKTGFLFAAAEAGNHGLYQFAGLGDGAVAASVSGGSTARGDAPAFTPTPLTNLVLVDELDSLAPMTGAAVANLLKEEVPQIYALCGARERSTLRLLRPGASVTEMAASPLPGAPTGVWTLRKGPGATADTHIVASFANATLVLAVGDTVEEVTDSGLSGTVATLCAASLADGSLLQAHAGGLRHVRPDGRVAEWRAPGRRAVTVATANERQAVVGLAGGELLAFELDASGALAQTETRDLGADVAALDLPPVPPGRARSRFLAVSGYDATIKIMALDPGDGFKVLALQAAPAVAESLCTLPAPGGALVLHAGLTNGVLLRADVDTVTGQLSDARSRFLGTRPPRLTRARSRGAPALLALSSRPWLVHAADGGTHALVPLAYDALDVAAGFASAAAPDGVVGAAGGSLRVLSLDRVTDGFNSATCRLRHTPRRLVVCEEEGVVIVGEADVGVGDPEKGGEGGGDAPMAAADGEPAARFAPEFDEAVAAERERVGDPRSADASSWRACVRVVDPATLATRALADLDAAITAMCLVTFKAAPEQGALLAVGACPGLKPRDRAGAAGEIRIYRLASGASSLKLMHVTPAGGVVGALHAFRGRLLAGVGRSVITYDLGRAKLLRKAELHATATHVVSLSSVGARVFAGDQTGSVVLLRHRSADGCLHPAADEPVPRHVSAAIPLDYDSVAVGDKFGSVAVLRLDADASAAVEADPTGGASGATGAVGAAAGPTRKLVTEACVHVGDAVTWLARAALQPGGSESLLFGTLGGRLGALVPLTTRADADFAASLEMHARLAAPPLAGRDHLAYRSAYYPVRHVVDGDLCEAYGALPAEARARIAGELERAPGEVVRKLEDVRARVL
jgi:splicing factor 3B subunit 3